MRNVGLEVKRFLNTDLDSMRSGWKARKEWAWKRDFCSHELWRKAIDAGWTIISVVTFRSEDQLSFIAECEEAVTE